MKKCILLSSLILALFSILLIKPIKAESESESLLEVPNLISLNNQTGVHYCSFDSVSLHVVDHTSRNSFVGITLSNLEFNDFSGYNAMIVQYENASNQLLDFRQAYNMTVGNSNYSTRINSDKEPAYASYDLETFEFFSEYMNAAASVTTSRYKVPAFFSGYIVIPMNAGLKNVNSLTFYGQKTDMTYGKFNIGNVYVANVNFPSTKEETGTITEKELVWSVNFNRPNYSKNFYSWADENANDIDDAITIEAVHAKEFVVTTNWRIHADEYPTNKTSMYALKYPEEIKNKYGKYDLSNLKGIVLDVENISDVDFKYNNMYQRFRTEWVSRSDYSVYFMPNDGVNYLGPSNIIPAHFVGKLFIPYVDELFYCQSLDEDLDNPDFTYETYSRINITTKDNPGAKVYFHHVYYSLDDLRVSNASTGHEYAISGNGVSVGAHKSLDVKNRVSLNDSVGILLNIKNNKASSSALKLTIHEKTGEFVNLGEITIPESNNTTIYFPFDNLVGGTQNGRVDGILERLVFDSEDSDLSFVSAKILYKDNTESDEITSFEETQMINVTKEVTEGGDVLLSGETLFSGENLVITPKSNDGYHITDLRVNNRQVKLTNGKYVLEDVDSDVVVKATFEKNPVEETQKGCKGSISSTIYIVIVIIGFVGVVSLKKYHLKQKEN